MENQITTPPLIYGKIASAMAEIEAVGKTRRNQQQGYNFRSIDDFYDSCQPVLSKYRIFIAPTILEHSREERQTKSGGCMMTTITKVRFRIYAEDGSYIEADALGEGADSGDKSANKAAASAMKYLFMQVFSVRVNGENHDPENDSPAYTPKPQPQQRPAATTAQVAPKPSMATEKTRAWAYDHLKAITDELMIVNFLKTLGWLDEMGTWKLEYVPQSKAALAELSKELQEYVAMKAARSSQPEPESDLPPPNISNAVITIPRKGMKREDYLKAPDTIGSLYAAAKGGNQDAGKRLFGLANAWQPEGWNGQPPKQEDVALREALDLFCEWREKKGEK